MIDAEHTNMDAKQDNSRKSVNIFHILKNTVVHHCDLQSILYFKLFLKLLDICTISFLCYSNVFCKDTTLGALYIAALVVSIFNITQMFLAVKAFSDNFKVNFEKYGCIFCDLADSLKKELNAHRETEADNGISIHMKEQLRFLKDLICLITLDGGILLVNVVCLMKDKDWSYASSYKIEMYSLYTTIAILTAECICMILREPFLEEITGLKKLLTKFEETYAAQDCSTNEITEDVEETESAVNEIETSENGILNDSGFDDNVKDQKETPFSKIDTYGKNSVEEDNTVERNEKETSRESSSKEMIPEETTENEKHTDTRPDASIKSDHNKKVQKKNKKNKRNKKNKHEFNKQKSDNLTVKESIQEKYGVSKGSTLDAKEDVQTKKLAKLSTICKTGEGDNNNTHDSEPHYTSNTGEELEMRVEDGSHKKNVEETDNLVDPPPGDGNIKEKSRRNAVNGPAILSTTHEKMKQMGKLKVSTKKRSVKITNSSEKMTSIDKSGESPRSENTVDGSQNYINTEKDPKQEKNIENSSETKDVVKSDSFTEQVSSGTAGKAEPSENKVNSSENHSNAEENMKLAEMTNNISKKQIVETTNSSAKVTSIDKTSESQISGNAVDGLQIHINTENDTKQGENVDNSSETKDVVKTDSFAEQVSSGTVGEAEPSENKVKSPENHSNTEENMKQAKITNKSSEKHIVEKTDSSAKVTSIDEAAESQRSGNAVEGSQIYINTEKDTQQGENIDSSSQMKDVVKSDSFAEQLSSSTAGEAEPSENKVNSSDNLSNAEENMKLAEMTNNISEKQIVETSNSSAKVTSIDKDAECSRSGNAVDGLQIHINTENDTTQEENIDNSSETKYVVETDSFSGQVSSGTAGEAEATENKVISPENLTNTEKNMKQAEMTNNISTKQIVEKTDSSAKVTSIDKAAEVQRSENAVDGSQIPINPENDTKRGENVDNNSEKKDVVKTDSFAEQASSGTAGEVEPSENKVISPEYESNTEKNMKQVEMTNNSLEKQIVEKTHSSAKATSIDKAAEGSRSGNAVDGSQIYRNTEKDSKQGKNTDSSSETKDVVKSDSFAEQASNSTAGAAEPSENKVNSLENHSNAEENMKLAEITNNISEKQIVETSNSSAKVTSIEKALESQRSGNAVDGSQIHINTENDTKLGENVDNNSETKDVGNTGSFAEQVSSVTTGEVEQSENKLNSSENHSNTEENMKLAEMTYNISENQIVETTNSSAKVTSIDKDAESQRSGNAVDSLKINIIVENDTKLGENVHNSSETKDVVKTDSFAEQASSGTARKFERRKNKVISRKNKLNREKYMKQAKMTNKSSEKQIVKKADSSAKVTSIDKAAESQRSGNAVDGSQIHINTENDTKLGENVDNNSETKEIVKTGSYAEQESSGAVGEAEPSENKINSSENHSNTEENMKLAEMTTNISEKQIVKKTDSSAKLISSDLAVEDNLSRNALESPKFYSNAQESMKQVRVIQSGSQKENVDRTTNLADPLSSNKVVKEDSIRSEGSSSTIFAYTDGGIKHGDDGMIMMESIKSSLETKKDKNSYSQSRVELTEGAFKLRFNYSKDDNLSFVYMKNPKGSTGIIADHYCKYNLSPRKNT